MNLDRKRKLGAVWYYFFGLLFCFFEKDITRTCLVMLFVKIYFKKNYFFKKESIFFFIKDMFQENKFLKQKLRNNTKQLLNFKFSIFDGNDERLQVFLFFLNFNFLCINLYKRVRVEMFFFFFLGKSHIANYC